MVSWPLLFRLAHHPFLLPLVIVPDFPWGTPFTLPFFALIPSPSSPPPAKPAPVRRCKGIGASGSDFNLSLSICLHQSSGKPIFGCIEALFLLGLHPMECEPGTTGGHLDMDSKPANRGGLLEQRQSHRPQTCQSTWIQARSNNVTPTGNPTRFSYAGPFLFKSI